MWASPNGSGFPLSRERHSTWASPNGLDLYHNRVDPTERPVTPTMSSRTAQKHQWLELEPVRALFAVERVWLDATLRARAVGVKLWLAPDAIAAEAAAENAALGLHPCGRAWDGALRAASDALPLADSSVALIVLQHVLEDSPACGALLRECARVLSADGELVVLGLNPMSLWHGYLRFGARAPRRWQLAGRLRARLLSLGLKVSPPMGLGPLRPGGHMEALAVSGARRLPRAAYALRARKHEAQVIPLRRELRRAAPAQGPLVPTASTRCLRVGAG